MNETVQQPAANPAKPAPEGNFQELQMPVRSFGNQPASRYKVYKSANEFVAVEAQTAVEALRLSGVSEPERIVRHIPGREVLVDVKRMLE